MGASSYVHVHVDEIRRETELAFLLVIDGIEVWTPKACVADGDSYEQGDVDLTLSIAERFAAEKGIEGES